VPCFFCNNKFLINLNKKVIMGRGDIKTKKGKIFAGSFGKSRPAKAAKKVVAAAVVVEKKKAAPKKKA
jgi:30S ribosomal protein S31